MYPLTKKKKPGRPELAVKNKQIYFSVNEKKIKPIKKALQPIVDALNSGKTIAAIEYTQTPAEA